ncbi:probable cytochrome P450 6a20 [Condylostylus longicornis]|uniref:probable cytochrome P450 6a20 n=1 Tax=Condylostylus longicornis TaxID=2530218 RepID=UPI00244DB275|nr:probable cytochrome P450 6a20 [Condylostylus longicornis]
MILIFIAIILILTYVWLKTRFTYWKRKKIPYLEPDIPYGNLKGVGNTVMIGERFRELYKAGKKLNHPFVGIYMFINPCALILDLDLLKRIYIKDFQHFHDRDIYHNEEDDPLSAHLLSLTGMKWKNLRSKLSPTFTSGKMKFMFPTVLKVGEKLVDFLDESIRNSKTDKTELQMKEVFSCFTTDVIGTCAFGIECNSLKDPRAEFRKYGRKIIEEPRIGVLLRLFATFFPNLCRKLHVKSERDDVSEFFMSALRETIDFREKNNVKRNDFLDMMIELKNSPNEDERLTFNEIAAQAYIFFLAGFETASTTLGFCVYELAKHPEIQQKCREEIENVYRKHGEKWTYEGIMELHYTHRIVDETLRKYPPVAINLREVTSDYLVTETNDIIEKGQRVIISVYGLHYDEEYYPDPEKFDPDRFLPENIAKRPQFTYLPFGEGPRHCIGKRFGLLQTYIGLASILRSFKITFSDKTVSRISYAPKAFILAPSEPILLNVEYMYYNEKDDPLSAHLLSLTGVKWKTLRSKFSPTFTSAKMKFMFPTVLKVGENLEEKLHKSLYVIGSCVFGIECNSLKNPQAEFSLYGRKVVDEPRIGVLLRLLAFEFCPNLCRKLHIKTERDDVSEFFLNALRETIDFREKNNIKRNDFLDIMIELKNSPNEDERLTFNEIAAQAYIFFLAGFETASTTLSFCVYEIAKSPEIQQKCKEEIENTYNKYGDEWTYEGILELHYMHRVVDETLRKYPAIYLNIREVTSNYLVRETNDVIEKGQRAIVPVYGIHHDEEYYPDPEKFDPDRFLPENIAKRPQFTYLPFGEGPRNCIAKRFGLLITYIGLASILRKFKITFSNKTVPCISFSPKAFVLTPNEPILLNVKIIST